MDNTKQEMLYSLLEGLEAIGTFFESREDVADQFAVWLMQVTATLEAAGMHAEYEIWNQALQKNTFSPYSPSLPFLMASKKAILLGMIQKYGTNSANDELFSLDVVAEARGYVQRIAEQVIGCYSARWYDACAVMLRRLVETLIIECFEDYGIQQKITGNDGNYFYLGDLITSFLSETTWHISRNARSSIMKLKDIKDAGDLSAHNPRYIATRHDIYRFAKDVRIVLQELTYIAGASKRLQSTF